jgi:predicted dehydrogenase
VALVGAGQFGANHARVIHQSEEAELAAVVDVDAARAAQVAAGYGGCPVFTDAARIVGLADAAVIAAPTTAHADLGCPLLEAGIDLLVEKPMAADLGGADRLIASASAAGRILQVGHLERFNPAVAALEAQTTLPLFFEIHRMNTFSPRSLDVDVVLDLMIHDIDIVLALAPGELEEIHAAGIKILSSRVDIANVRLQFTSGCVANLTASRVSTERVRKLRLFQPHQYISLDYGKQEAVSFRADENRQISFSRLASAAGEPLSLQFAAFLESVRTRAIPKVNGAGARKTLETALAILDKIEVHGRVVARSLAEGWKPRM